MKLTAEQIQGNWVEFLTNIETHISSPRKEKLIEFYKKYEERIILMPAAHKKEYHNAFPGGYVDHVNRVVSASLRLYDVWTEFEMDCSTFTIEELVFSALNHDLGKMGDEDYKFNYALAFASVPDRSLFMLQSHGITYTFNEMVAIQTHDGLYDEANSKYLKSFMPETKPRTSLPYIIHQADLLAARVEFEKEWLQKIKSNLDKPKTNFTLEENKKSTTSTKNRALGDVKSQGLKNLLDSL